MFTRPMSYALILSFLVVSGCGGDTEDEPNVANSSTSQDTNQEEETVVPNTDSEGETVGGAEGEPTPGVEEEATGGDDELEGPQLQYLKGTSTTTSPDGNIVYEGPVNVLAKKTIDPEKGTIVEDTLHGDEERKTIFTQQAGTLVFDVEDEEKTFSGTVTFETDDWAGSNVIYDIEIFGQFPGTITGTGTWQGDTYTTDKEYANPEGVAEARTEEILTIITEEEYLEAIAQ